MGDNANDKIADLRELFDAGMLTEEEFTAMRDDLRGSSAPAPPAPPSTTRSLADKAPPPPPPSPPAPAPSLPARGFEHDFDLDRPQGSQAMAIRGMHGVIGGMVILTGLGGTVSGLALMGDALGVGLMYATTSALYVLMGFVQVGLALTWTKPDRMRWNVSMAISVVQMLTCSIFGFLLLFLHMRPGASYELRGG